MISASTSTNTPPLIPANVHSLRIRLWDDGQSGFRPVELYSYDANHKDAGKAPMGREWPERARQNPPEAVVKLPHPLALNTGILCDGLRVIDIDVDDEDQAKRVQHLALDMFGEAPTRYRDNSPKMALIYRASEGEPGSTSITGKRHKTGVFSQKVEILGHGRQLAAFGIHPTGAQLLWRPEAPGDVARDGLPAVTEDQIAAFLAAASPIIEATAPTSSTSTGERKTSQLGLVGDLFEIMRAIEIIPNGAPADWVEWRRVGMAIWAAADGTEVGRELWHLWSAKHPDYDQAATEALWIGFHKNPPKEIGAGTIIKMARDAQSPATAKSSTAPANTNDAQPPTIEPVDFLADELGAAPKLESRHVPAVIWKFASDTARRMGVDPTSVALGGLVACASVASDEWAVQPKRHDTAWTENPRIWAAIVGDPSIRKSPVVSACTKPIDKLEAEARQRHADEMKKWQAAADLAKTEKKGPPPKPRCDRFMAEGTTIEALSEILRDDEEAKFRTPAGKVLSRQDEMSEFFGALDQYKAGGKGGSDRGAYLRFYNGGRYTIDRVMRGSFVVPNWSACFLGGIQPGPIQRIAKEAAEDGLLQRFMYCVPDHQSEGEDRAPDHDAITAYNAIFPVLVGLHPQHRPGTKDAQSVVFHAEAHQHREQIDALASTMMLMPDTTPRLKAALGKWPGLFARLCLTFHLIEIATSRANGDQGGSMIVISAGTAKQVADFMRDIILPHMLRAHAVMFSTDQTGHARWIAHYILARNLERITTRDIGRAYRELRAPEAKRELDSVMGSLVAVGWVEPENPDNPVKPVNSWRVNPAVHSIFAEKAKAEANRRLEVRKKIEEYTRLTQHCAVKQ